MSSSRTSGAKMSGSHHSTSAKLSGSHSSSVRRNSPHSSATSASKSATVSNVSKTNTINNNTANNTNTAANAAREAFNEIVKAISKDMPLVMHGSGDVAPNEVHTDSASVLSELTANYIADLVDAAIDAHEILNDGPQPLPLPPLPRSKTIPKPSPPEPPKKPDNPKDSKDKKSSSAANTSKTDKNKTNTQNRKKRRRVTDEYWDEPMKEPKIKNKPTTTTPPTAAAKTAKGGHKFEGVHVDEWVGLAGVDFFDTRRSRKAYVSAPSAIGTSSFIFPVCHDVGLYGKVLEVQTARRSIAPILADPVLQDVVRNEAAIQGTGGLRKRRTKKANNSNEEDIVDEPDDTDSEGEDGATWPGLDGLLPIYKSGKFLTGDF